MSLGVFPPGWIRSRLSRAFLLGRLHCFILLPTLGGSLPAFSQAEIWRLSENLGSSEQWTVYGRDPNAGSRGLPVTTGDFNGDGLSDVALTGVLTDTWIVLSDGLGGEFDLLEIDLQAIPSNVVRLVRDTAAPGYASELASGDFNRDGLDDLLIGSQTNNADAGAVYIIWGNSELGGQTIELGGEPPPGLTITTLMGTVPGQRIGLWVKAADIDRDGVDDLLISADQTSGSSIDPAVHAGSAHVVFGTLGIGAGTLFGTPGSNNLVALDAIPSQSGITTIHGIGTEDHFGSTIAAGDLDSDSLPEVIVSAALLRSGAQGTSTGFTGHGSAGADGLNDTRVDAGETYIIWDEAIPTRGSVVDLRGNPPESLTRIIGPRAGEYNGEEIETGDLDGDGRPDLLIGAILGNGRRGGVWVLYNAELLKGKTIDLSEVDSSSGELSVGGEIIRTSELRGINLNDIMGDTIRARDLNGDGFDDLMIGLPSHSSSQVIILFGSSTPLPPLLDFAADPTLSDPRLEPFHPLRILEVNPGDTIAYSMHAGDFDGDGTIDLLINAMLAPAKGGTGPGFPNRPGQAHFISGKALSLRAGAPFVSSVPGAIWSRYSDPVTQNPK